jgi:hypothetical protein
MCRHLCCLHNTYKHSNAFGAEMCGVVGLVDLSVMPPQESKCTVAPIPYCFQTDFELRPAGPAWTQCMDPMHGPYMHGCTDPTAWQGSHTKHACSLNTFKSKDKGWAFWPKP